MQKIVPAPAGARFMGAAEAGARPKPDIEVR